MTARRRSQQPGGERREIARQYGRHERWGRLVKKAGLAGEFTDIDPEEAAGDGMAQA